MKIDSCVYLSIGSNINDRVLNLNLAVKYLSEKLKILKVSSLYESEPLYYKSQNMFLNMVVHISTTFDIFDLLSFCKKIEIKMGRKKNKYKNRERIIDIDILTYNELIYSDKQISIPHPKIHERKFVLIPWIEISPNFFIVNYKKNVTSLLSCTKDKSKVIKLV